MFRRFKSFLKTRAGNVSVSFALVLLPLMTSVGGALDLTRTYTVGEEIQSALDAGTLAAASLTQIDDPETVVRNYVNAALNDHSAVLESLVVEVETDIALNARRVIADAQISVPTLVLGLVGVERLNLVRASEADEEVRNLEISLVLDVSGSMGGSKISALRDAAEEFVTVVMDPDLRDLTSISVIPYNGGVRLPEDITNRLVPGTPDQTGCLEMGSDHATTVDLAVDGFDWLDWYDRAQHGSRSSSFCPESDEAAMFMRRDQSELITLIRDLDAGGNTGLDIATAWGARALDPVWQGRLGGDFNLRPVSYDDRSTLKVLVVMTDGAATPQYRTYRDSNGYWRTYSLYSAATARENMILACEGAAERGVQIYTIAFQVSGNTNRTLMRNCASAEENYYQVEDLDISAAFSAIAADLNSLRLSR